MSSSSGAQHDAPSPNGSDADTQLVERARQGDRGAYGRLVIRYQDRLFNAMLRLLGDRDDALEITQETFARGLTKLETFRGNASIYTWMFRIALNLGISHLRSVQKKRTFSLDGARGRSPDAKDQASGLLDRIKQDDTSDPARQVELRERNEQVLKALGKLDAEYRAVLVMRDIEGFDYQQMADQLGLPLGTLKSRLFRARVALRDQLREYLTGSKL